MLTEKVILCRNIGLRCRSFGRCWWYTDRKATEAWYDCISPL